MKIVIDFFHQVIRRCDIYIYTTTSVVFFFFLEVKLRNGKSAAVKKYKGDWNHLPDLLLENIFSFLNVREKYYASTTCRSWHSVFRLPYSWHTFVFDDTTLTRRKFNYYSGWQVSTVADLWGGASPD